MYRVALCDSDLIVVDKMSEIINRLLIKKSYLCELEKFETVDGLKKAVMDRHFSLIIIDMDLKANRDFVKKIRHYKVNTGIILISSRDKQWEIGYELHAISFIVKPVSEERLECAILHNLKYVMTKDCLIGMKDAKGKSYAVSPADITYIDIIDKDITVHLIDKSKINYKGSLSSISEKLVEPFLRCHNSYIVNMDYISCYKRYEFILKDETLVRISKQQYKKVLYAFNRYKINRYF